MSTLDLGLHRRVRVWRDSSGLPVFEPDEVHERSFRTTTLPSAPAGHAAIEALLPRGATVMYGALGGRFSPDESISQLRVRVHHLTSTESDRPYESTLVVPPEEAHLGLPRELVDAVIAGVDEQLIIGPDPGGGELVLDRAAYGLIGSSEELFRMLARAMVRLLAAPSDLTDDEMTSVLSEVLA